MDIIRQITISEVILLFNLLFVLPALAFLVWRLRAYERQHGEMPLRGAGKKKDGKEESAPAPATPVPDDAYPYRLATFLSPGDQACLKALVEAMGGEVLIFPKVALWEVVEAAEAEAGYRERLKGKAFDFLVCDRVTCLPLTAVMYRPGKGRPSGPLDELKKICAAAGAKLVFIEQADDYNADRLKAELGIPDLGI